MEQNNPFKAPEARVADVLSEDNGDLVIEGQKVETGRGTAWLSGGWEMFKQAPGVWIGLSVVYMVVIMAASIIPLVNMVAPYVLTPILIGGIMLGCKALEQGDQLTVGHLFAGFSNRTGNLAVAGLFYLLGFVVIMVVVFVIALVMGFSAAATKSTGLAIATAVIVGLVVFALMVPLLMAIWFAPALILFHDVAPLDSLKASFQGCLKNMLPFLIYGLVYLLLAIAATLPILLGWLILMPVTMASIYVSYRDIFIRR
jgi:uncharacterized membrane protein